MGRLSDFFAGRSVAAYVERARRKMATGKLEDAARTLQRGLALYPSSSTLLDLQLSLRRARAHTSIRELEVRIEERGDPHAYEELIDLYRRLELPEEARRRAQAYVENYPDRDTPHFILGSMQLDEFFEDLRAHHGHEAHENLLKAASLNAMAVQPRLLLAELYFCLGADQSLRVMMQAVEKMASHSEALQAAMSVIWHLDDDGKEDRLDGIFERIECTGHLARAPEDWPLSKRRRRVASLPEEHADSALLELVRAGTVDELVALRRDGSVVGHVTQTGLQPPQPESEEETTAQGLLGVVRTVARKVLPQAGEFDLGRFRRCTIQGRFGNIVIGRVDATLTGARGPASVEPHRMWQQIRLKLERGSEEGAE